MSTKQIKDMPASVHERLLQKARKEQRPFNELLQYFALERFLYRWSRSAHATTFFLKGALMLRTWNSPETRPTMDIDMLGKKSSDLNTMTGKVKEVIAVEVAPDGLAFDPKSVTAVKITEDADYEGVRINFRGNLGNARIDMQIDFAFGDMIYPGPQKIKVPSLLDFPPAILLGYSRESSIAEKFEAMVNLGDVNSRMKDFFDIWALSRGFDFDGKSMSEAIRLTFKQRGTDLPNPVASFERRFIELKQVQWTTFHKRLKRKHVPADFDEIVKGVESFLSPIVNAMVSDDKVPGTWIAPGPWK